MSHILGGLMIIGCLFLSFISLDGIKDRVFCWQKGVDFVFAIAFITMAIITIAQMLQGNWGVTTP